MTPRIAEVGRGHRWHDRSVSTSLPLGGIEIVMLEDGVGPFFQPRGEAFSATVDQWARADAFDPGAVLDGGGWLLRFRCFAIRQPSGRVILVDAGIGPSDAPSASWAPVPGRLPEELAAAGIERDDVDTVVLSHIHTDHVGWAVTGGEPYFRNARYLLQAADVQAMRDHNPALVPALLEPLMAAGRLDIVAGDQKLVPGVSVIATPGHTPGHQSVLVTGGDERVLVTGDLLVHALQLLHPDIAYAHEVDPEAARISRRRALKDLGPGGILATSHLTDPFVRLPTAP
ncbi:MAG: MBL fold metallo-hydrolase [Hamadaea sp.]|nr:MBL fold metallo-hydrolase [Hamadaea sp.]